MAKREPREQSSLAALPKSSPPASITSPPHQGTDSGYASAAATPDRASLDGSGSTFEYRAGKVFKRKVTKLRMFDKEISSAVQDRFLDLVELFDRPLYGFVSKTASGPSAISIKLKTLGECEATAKPWIVVQCDATVSKRVQQFFNRVEVKSEMQPGDLDQSLPNFEVIVTARPPRPIALTTGCDVFASFNPHAPTLCGKTITTRLSDETRMATIGGVIKVVGSDNSVVLYGMTAGHVFATEDPIEDEAYQYDFGEEPDNSFALGEPDDVNDDPDGSCLSVSEDVFELDLDPKEAQDLHYGPPNEPLYQDPCQDDTWRSLWSVAGRTSVLSSDNQRDKQNLDWSLIEIEDRSLYRPNVLVLADKGHRFVVGEELKESSRRSTRIEAGRPVIIICGVSGAKWGRLLAPSSFLMMGKARKLTETYNLSLSDGSVLQPGDCGSWVIDDVTHEVYGHVVASDPLGDIYVVPLKATLQHIEEQLMAQSVCLPTENEVQEWVAQCSQSRKTIASAEPTLAGICVASEMNTTVDDQAKVKHEADLLLPSAPPTPSSDALWYYTPPYLNWFPTPPYDRVRNGGYSPKPAHRRFHSMAEWPPLTPAFSSARASYDFSAPFSGIANGLDSGYSSMPSTGQNSARSSAAHFITPQHEVLDKPPVRRVDGQDSGYSSARPSARTSPEAGTDFLEDFLPQQGSDAHNSRT